MSPSEHQQFSITTTSSSPTSNPPIIVKKPKNSSSKNNQHIFIKPVRTAQNGQRFIIARCTCQSIDKQIRVNQKQQNRTEQVMLNSPTVGTHYYQGAPATSHSQTNIVPITNTESSTNNKDGSNNNFGHYFQRQVAK